MTSVMIIAGESSGELYGSLLAGALKKRWPDLHITGIGGERMRGAGVELIAGTSDAFGLIEAVSAIGKIRNAFNAAIETMRKSMPAVIVLIDYPDFNLKVAKAAQSLGIKILYYVSPQVWAWRRGRVKKIAGLVDRMAVILPFEEALYRDAGLPTEFVGHPILEEIGETLRSSASFSDMTLINRETRAYFKASLGLDPGRPLISILPGSRPSELSRHLPLMIDVVRGIKCDPEMNGAGCCQICMPLAPNTDEGKFSSYLEELRREGVMIRKGESVKILAASDSAIITSGTATLQAALLEVPMVVIYKLSPVTYRLGRLIIKVQYISLVNLLSGREVIKELIQEDAEPARILHELKKVIFDQRFREEMIKAFRLIRQPFLGKNASERVAEIVIEMAGKE